MGPGLPTVPSQQGLFRTATNWFFVCSRNTLCGFARIAAGLLSNANNDVASYNSTRAMQTDTCLSRVLVIYSAKADCEGMVSDGVFSYTWPTRK